LKGNDDLVYRTSSKIQERKDAKRRYILETVAKVFAVKGYYNANVRDILDEAGISTGSFYFYFNNNYADRIGGVKSKF
jgi:TetR/AcrR family transcriptional regulator, fatty acid metabolism regulator protein